ncbi:MFS transporter [Cohnella candidum]|uniref:MFS transporter n=1 Tax=Cohnella candidum TaxID=2674991 RepID=A0A3G3K3J1_9BACL|nr:MFS transporter [Cohnella candidum]AYQ75053.1 MFS transporter [Cohnella candidum]
MKDIFGNRIFVRLFLATIASQLGTIVGNMAFAFYLLDRYSSQPGYASLAELMYSLPTLLVFWLVGVAADRFDRRRIAENSAWIRVVLTAVLLLVLYGGWLPLAFAVLFLRSAVSKFYAPAESALLQGILAPEQYVAASGLNQTVMGVFMMFGVSLGALSYHVFGILGAVVIDGIGLLAVGFLIRSCKVPAEVALPNGKTTWRSIRLREITADFSEGIRYIRRFPLLLSLIGGFLLFGLLNGGFAVLPMYTMKYKLAPDQYTFYSSLFAVFLGIGFLLGGIIGPALVNRFKPHRVIIVSLLGSGLASLALIAADEPWFYLSVVLVIGVLLAPLNIAIGGWLPSLVDAKQMGRVSAWNDPLLMLSQSVALGLIALLYPGTISLETIYASLSVILLLAFLFYLVTLPRYQRQHEQTAPSHETAALG